MGKVVVYADSTCDLSEELIMEHNIGIIPLYVTFGEEIFKDKLEINPDILYKKVSQKGIMPKTSAAPMGDYYEVFKQELDKGNEVVFFSIGSTLSSSINNARTAAEELDASKILVIDSLNLSTGIGLQVLKAAKFAKEGKTLAEIKTEIEKVTPNVRSKFAVDSLEYLHKGGRCSGASRLFGTLLQIKPVIEVQQSGKLDVLTKCKGKKKALNVMLDDIIANKDRVDLDYIMVTHTYADDEAVMLQAKLKEEFPSATVAITTAGCVISSHCGKGTIGILYILK